MSLEQTDNFNLVITFKVEKCNHFKFITPFGRNNKDRGMGLAGCEVRWESQTKNPF